MIKTVTFTGADDTTSIERMLEISKRYPFVEWGVLIMPNKSYSPRWPSVKWIDELLQHSKELNLALHLCGKYVDNILKGKFIGLPTHPGRVPLDWSKFKRIQINTHGEPTYFHEEAMLLIMKNMNDEYGTEFIFQYDQVNTAVNVAAAKGIKCSALFDLSHGTGVLPSDWPDLLPNIKCGYAGGLGPDNLVEQIKLIEERAGDTPIWIDMETKVRSLLDDVNIFDLEKVEKCLELSSPFVK